MGRQTGPVGLLLASGSPRRRELLDQIGVRYRVISHHCSEDRLPAEEPLTFVERLALEKARSVADNGRELTRPSDAGATEGPLLCRPVLGADTIVVRGGRILGKPRGREEAVEMLQQLSGVRHQVYSAVALTSGDRSEVLTSRSEVLFRELSREECERYWLTGEPQDKAGAYAIQGCGALFVMSLTGSYSGVMGLPLYETSLLLKRFGVPTALYP